MSPAIRYYSGDLMIRLLTLSAIALILTACTPTAERLKAERMVQERTSYYSMQAGDIYRYPAHDYPWEETPRAMPDFAALSYSLLRPEPTIVEVQKGRMGTARPQSRPQFASGWVYSPLTGEAIRLTNGKAAPLPAEESH